MKCPNCGFNCDDKYCAMCGTKMPEQVVNSNSNPYNQPQPPVNNANSYPNNFQGSAPNMPQGRMPVPPAYPAPPQYSNAPKKKSKALPIILTCLIAAVIVAGAVISIYSACTYNQSIIADIIGDNSYNSNDYYVDEEIYPDTEYIEDVETHKIGETKELSDCKVTLAKVEKDKSAEESKTGNSRTKFVFEIENTTDIKITPHSIWCDATNANGGTSFEWLSDNLETDDDTFSDYIVLEPNEKKELIFEYSVPNDTEKIRLDLSFNSDGDKYEYNGTFVAE